MSRAADRKGQASFVTLTGGGRLFRHWAQVGQDSARQQDYALAVISPEVASPMPLLIVQTIGPLVLLVLLARPSRHRFVQPLKAIATFFAILAVQNAGLWMDLPWWTPWLMWLLFAACLVIGRNTRLARATSLLAGALWGGAAAAMGWIAVTALLSRLPPAGPVAEISSPLPDGRYPVVNGRSRSLTNSHLETLNPRTPRQASHRGQSHGIDLVGLTAFGRTSTGCREREPSRYAIFGTPVLAPCAGTVVRALDGRTDMAVPIPDSVLMAGNHVLLRCGRVEILLAHLRKGSLSVSAGARVRLGQKLGEAGNSGNSDTPHLHVHAQLPGSRDAPLSGEPIPLRINGRYLVRGDRL
jgi:hypothetical protein